MKYLFTILQIQFIVTLLCYGTFGQVQTEEYTPDENTILLFHLNETSGSTAYDESQYGNDGTIHGNQPSEGKFFGGRTYPNNNTDLGITLPYTSSLNIVGGDPITMESWIKTDIYFQGGTNIIKLDEYVLSLGSFGSKGHLQILRRDGNNWNICEVNNLIPLNEWVHVMATYDGNDTKMYINGIEQEYTVFINAYFQVDTIRIASFKGSIVPVNTNVLIDEVRISDVARDKDLVAYYPFNGNANDESGNGNNGTVEGANLTTDRFGNCNSAYNFDGNDDEIILGSEPFNFINHSYSISVWAYWERDPTLGTHIFDKQGYPVNGGGGYRLYTGGNGELVFSVSNDVTGTGFVDYNTHIIPTQNTWYHIAVSVDVTGFTTVYVNGEDKVTGLSEPLIGNVFELKLGTRIDFNNSRFGGIIDDVRLYNYALTEAEILELYNEQQEGNCFVASYPFSGNANDVSGNNIHLNIFGNPTLVEDRLGNPNSAYYFDGINDYMYHDRNDLLTQWDEMTLYAWIKNDGIDGKQDVILSTLDYPDLGGYQLALSQQTNKIAFLIRESTGSKFTDINYAPTYVGEWIMIVGVYTHNGLKLYINGLLVDEYIGSVSVTYDGSNNFRVGTNGHIKGADRRFKGIIDEVGIYCRALTDEEVFDLYNEIIPVELTSFTASTSKGKVTLNWATATETNNSGFEVERKQENSVWGKIGFVEGHGTTTEIQSYQFIDDISDIQATSLSYRLKQIDYDGSYEYSDVVEVTNPTPTDFALHQNFPNPYNPTTTITYSLPIKSQVELVIYNTLGESVVQLVNEEKEAGRYEVEFSAAALPSGIYFYRIQVYARGRAGSFNQTKKMILLK